MPPGSVPRVKLYFLCWARPRFHATCATMRLFLVFVFVIFGNITEAQNPPYWCAGRGTASLHCFFFGKKRDEISETRTPA